MKKYILFILALFLIVPSLTFAQEQPQTKVVMETSLGALTIALEPEKAPKTVANFLAYAKKGFYDGTIFHRVIKGFMIQGGGFTQDMQRKPTDQPIANEADNGLKNSIGTIAMARTPDPHSATSQFFINTADNVFLNHRAKNSQGWGYCVFGRVVDGMEVVHAIEQVQTGMRAVYRDVPLKPVIIKSVKLVEPGPPIRPKQLKSN